MMAVPEFSALIAKHGAWIVGPPPRPGDETRFEIRVEAADALLAELAAGKLRPTHELSGRRLSGTAIREPVFDERGHNIVRETHFKPGMVDTHTYRLTLPK